MYDRIPAPGQEGRMLISPEGGTPYYATVAMADNPTQEGTFINKATLLKDATAALFGLGANAVPDDVHNWVGQYATHWWSVLHGQASTGYKEVRADIAANTAVTGAAAITISLSKTLTIDQSTGAVALASPTTISFPRYPTTYAAIEPYLSQLVAQAPVYIQGLLDDRTGVYYLPAGSTYSGTSTGSAITVYARPYAGDYYTVTLNGGAKVSAQKITSQIYNIPAGSTTYVNSTDRNAYPDDATEGNLTYRYLGIPFDNAVTAPAVETGQYTGTGLYGADNPNSLTFPFKPKLLIVAANGRVSANYAGSFYWVYPSVGAVALRSANTSAAPFVTASENTVTWYATDSVSDQLNSSGIVYYYIAIG